MRLGARPRPIPCLLLTERGPPGHGDLCPDSRSQFRLLVLAPRRTETRASLGHDVVTMDLPCDDDTAGLAEYTDTVVDAIGDRTA